MIYIDLYTGVYRFAKFTKAIYKYYALPYTYLKHTRE